MVDNSTAAEGQGHIKTLRHEFMKQYFSYDGSSRIQYVYEVFAEAPHGTPCVKTTYTYVGVTRNVQKLKEEPSTWDSSWDV